MDVTEQYLDSLRLYGGGEFSNRDSLVGSKSIVYGQGPSMQRAIEQTVTTIPFDITYKGDIGLMGTENIFFKIILNIQDTGNIDTCFEEPGWSCTRLLLAAPELDSNYDGVVVDSNASEGDSPTYIAAQFTNELPFDQDDTLIGIRLINEGTGNIYEDANVDSRLYSICRFEHAFDDMLVGLTSTFYVGIHARNTKRNSYNVTCKLGTSFLKPEELTAEKKQLLPFCP